MYFTFNLSKKLSKSFYYALIKSVELLDPHEIWHIQIALEI
jgi:hypothetical protein